ncbi:hypothetical protein BGZ93_011289 [Podila epicladia]|nr:hypothetical protein BGZ92_000990 [Podila epicladia]KAG0086852.1 hypothetical protein BGZ93_011289 [Podila epicladia]
MTTQPGPGIQTDLYLGLDLSTQQLKAVALTTPTGREDDLETHSSFAIHFDTDLPHYHTRGGVTVHRDQEAHADDNESGVVTAPVLMWIEAFERLFDKMKAAKFPFERVVSVSGAAQQHGSVYWSSHALDALHSLSSSSATTDADSLVSILHNSFTVFESPIWQDTSTFSQCCELEEFLGHLQDKVKNVEQNVSRRAGQHRLAQLTGSRAFERFTGSQILKLAQKTPEIYDATARISLVSSFLASVLVGGYAAIDAADASGMNLLNIETRDWEPSLTRFISHGGVRGLGQHSGQSTSGQDSLRKKLGEVDASGRRVQGVVSQWFTSRYGFRSDVKVITFTGDNPATVIAMQAERGDAIVSLGTSDTLVLYTTERPHSQTPDVTLSAESDQAQAEASLSLSFLCHPVDSHGYLMLYCAKNGSLARERVRDQYAQQDWDLFDLYLRDAQKQDLVEGGASRSQGFYYFDAEIWPPIQGVYRFQDGQPVQEFHLPTGSKDNYKEYANKLNVLRLCESQFIAMRIRAMGSSSQSLSSGVTRILATGGASSNETILQLLADVFGVPVVQTSSSDQNKGSAAWGAAKKAFLFGRKDDMALADGAKNAESETRVLQPDLDRTRHYTAQIPEYLRLEGMLLKRRRDTSA